jgi:hypothetical protein
MKEGNLIGGVRSLAIASWLSAATLGNAQTQPVYAWTNFVGQPGGRGNADGTADGARFNAPVGVAVDAESNVYVADTSNHTLRKITPAGTVTTLAGMPGILGSADGTGSAARFTGPLGVAVNREGTLYLADGTTVRRVTASGETTTLAGRPGNRGLRDGTGSEALFADPSGVAVDGNGTIYVTDSNIPTVRKVTPAGEVTTLPVVPSRPLSVAVDREGTVYVADSGYDAILKLTPAGEVTALAGSFSNPAGVAVDATGNVYVADTDNHTIRRMTPQGMVTTVAGLAEHAGSTDGVGATARFNYPRGLAVDSAGNLYVADSVNQAIRKITPAGVVRTFAGHAESPGSADGTSSTARFYWPCGAGADNSGNLYVADTYNHTIRLVTPEGVVTTVAGGAGTPGRADGAGNAARFWYPSGTAVNGAGDVYVADAGNHVIRRVTPAGAVTTVAGSAGAPGRADGTGGAARFTNPRGVAVDGTGNVYVADAGNHLIRKATAAGVVTTLAGLAGNPGSADGAGTAARFNYPRGVAVDGTGNVYVADSLNGTIRKVTPAGVVATLAGSAGAIGDADGAGGTARFGYPLGIAVDGGGNAYVADLTSDTIRKVTPQGMVTTIGGVAGVLGGADGAGVSANFSFPSGIAVDNAGRLYVADAANHRVTKGVPIFVPVIFAQPTDVTNNVGTTVAFRVTAIGPAPLSYQWRFNGTNLAGASNDLLTLTNLQLADEGSYSVVVTNAFGATISSNALLTVNLPPTVSLSSPTNGTVMLAPATFTLIADATDDVAVSQVEFWSGTNSLGTVANAPWYVLQTNLPAGEYGYTAVAMDTLGLASTSTVSTVTVLSQPPTEAQALVTDGVLVRQTGLFYQTVRVSNPTLAPLAALRLWVELDANSLARGVQVWNATGRSNAVPYLSYNTSLAPGQSVDLQIEYYVPDRQPFPSPSFRTEVVVPDPPFEPAGTALGFVRQVTLANGLFLVEFSTTVGRRYYVQYSSDMTNWKTALPAIMGTGSRVQWIDNGPPKTESLPSSESSRFYRVILLP